MGQGSGGAGGKRSGHGERAEKASYPIRTLCRSLDVSASAYYAWARRGLQPAAMGATDAIWMLSPMLLPLMASVLAPWSLSRIRHA